MRRLAIAPAAAAPALALLAAGAASAAPPWDAQRAMQHIVELVKITPRSIGTPGHERAIDYIVRSLTDDPDISVARQQWSELRDDGTPLHLTNIIARLHPARDRRVLLGTHYDSIVVAYKDPDARLRAAPMPGANNSASGVAVLLETARVLSHEPAFAGGVDFVFFDGEEGPLALGEGDPHWHALGSPHFAAHIDASYGGGSRPAVAVILDMVCKRDLRLKPEPNSLASAPSELHELWRIGQGINPAVFTDSAPSPPIGDDQVALARLGIPSLLLIDFDYHPWFNTTHDTPDKCSGASLRSVGLAISRFAGSYAAH